MLGGKKSDATRKSWKLFSTPPTLGGGRGGEGCSLPVAHQSGRSTILNISGNSLDLFVNVLRVFFNFDSALEPEICSSPLGRTRPTTL